MRPALSITLALLAASLAGCHAHVHYSRHAYGYGYTYGYHYSGGYSSSYGSTGIQWNPPSPPPAPAAAAPASAGAAQTTGDVPVTGSDGSYGWQRACNADVEIHRVSEAMAHKGCTVDSYGYDETRAVCGGVHVLLRRDATHIYRLCPAGTEQGACDAAWSFAR